MHPIATSTFYRNTNQTGGETTTYAYTWHSGTVLPQQVTTTLPTVTTARRTARTRPMSAMRL